MNSAALTRVADVIEAGEHAGNPFTMAQIWTDGRCSSPGCIAGWTILVEQPDCVGPGSGNPDFAFHQAADLLGLDDVEADYLMGPSVEFTGYDYRREAGDEGYITRAHAVAALRDLAAGGECDETLWERTDPEEGRG